MVEVLVWLALAWVARMLRVLLFIGHLGVCYRRLRLSKPRMQSCAVSRGLVMACKAAGWILPLEVPDWFELFASESR